MLSGGKAPAVGSNFFLICPDLAETGVHMNHIGSGEDQTAENVFLVRLRLAQRLQGAFQTEDIVQRILQIVAHVVKSHRQCIGVALHLDQQTDVFDGHQVLGHGDEKQVRHMLGKVLFFHRLGDNALLDIVDDHGGVDLQTAQRGQKSVYIFGCLFQIEAHVRNLTVPGQTEVPDRFSHAPFHFSIHDTIVLTLCEKVNKEFPKTSNGFLKSG